VSRSKPAAHNLNQVGTDVVQLSAQNASGSAA
jgi:hypothetical protein